MKVKCKPTRTPDIGLPALREKYRQERDKRIRPEGQKQYVEAADDFADYYEADPYTPAVVRAAISEDLDVAVLGGGFAGLISAARIKQAGVSNLRIIELAGDFGGAWYWNRYPGIQCDTDSYCYLPLLEEVSYIPQEKYAYGAEVYEHCRRIGRHFGLYENALFGTLVRSLRWDGSIKRWRIGTNRGDDIRARFVVMCPVPLTGRSCPASRESRASRDTAFHTARWDYDYTGGDTTGGLDRLGDKRVAIIGTGASGIQCDPHPRPLRQAPIRLPAHTFLHRRSRQPADRCRNEKRP